MKETEIFYRHRLPHWQPPGATIFLTWRLFDSLPQHVIEQIRAERAHLQKETIRAKESVDARRMRHNKALFDITDALFHFDGARYDLIAFVVMPNHIHTLLTPLEVAGKGALLRTITQGLKGYTSREPNQLLKRTGQPFWQEESYDHWARNETENLCIVAYIECNPVNAGRVAKSEDWRWSSAWERAHGRLKGQEL